MREWWLRAALVLQSPRAVFVALRDDTDEAASDRAEPVLLIVLLAGAAAALASDASTGYDGLLLAVWAFLAGFLSRNDKLCGDGKPPVRERPDVALGHVVYQCHDGQLVTK